MASSDSGSTAMVELTIHKALTLVGLNPGGTSNPYVTATIGTQSVSTPVASKTVNPCYDCSFTFAQCQLPTILTLRVFNKLPYVEMEDAMGMATVTLFGPCDAQTRTVQLTHGGVAALAQRAPAGCGTLHITYCVTATPPSPTQQTQAQQETQQQAQQQQAQQQQQQPAVPLIVPPANSMVGGPLATPLQLPAATTTTQQQPSSQQHQQQSNGALLYASSPSMTAAPTAARSPNLTTSATAAAGSVYARQHAEQSSSSSSSDGDTPAAATATAAAGNSDAAHVAAADRQVGVCTPPSLVPPRVSPVPVLTQPGNLIAAQATTAPTATTSDRALVLNPTGLSTYVSYPVPGATPQPTAGGRGHGNGSSNNSNTSSSSNSDNNKGGSAMAARTLLHSSEMFYANNDVPAAQLPPPSLPPSLGGVTAEGGRTDNTDGSAAATALSLSPLPRTHEMAMLPVATVMSPKQQQQQQHSASSSANALTVPSPHDEAAAATLSRSVDAAPPAAAATSLREPYPPASRAPSLLQAPLLTPPSLQQQQQQQEQQPHEDERATAMHVARAPATPPLSSAASSARTTPSTLHYGSTQGGAAAVLPSQPVHGYRSNNNHTAATRQPGRGVHMVPSADSAAHSLPRQRGGRDVLPLVADDATAATTAAAVLRRTGAPQPVTAGLTSSSSSSLPSAQQRHHDAAVTAATTTSAAVALYADRVYLFEAAATGRDIAIFHELRRVDPRLTGGFVHCVDYAGATLLHCAAWHGQLAVMQVLLSAQPVAPALDVRGLVARTSGNTLLHAAACGGQAAVVQWLLYTHPTAGPLLLPLRNLRGMTAADCAKEAGFDALAQQLLSAAAAAAAAASSTMMRRV